MRGGIKRNGGWDPFGGGGTPLGYCGIGHPQ